ncbi:MAG: hydroxylamine reductase, partial [Clostridia bacterium]|nr:hydroxylamine reductase [Clostridia bacterium]
MFCFQCEQTAGCTGCVGKTGVCGKSAEVANIQDRLTGALIGLGRAAKGNEDKLTDYTHRLVIEALFSTLTNVNFDSVSLEKLIAQVQTEKARLIPECGQCKSPCGRNDDLAVNEIWQDDEDIRSLKSLILFGIRGLAAYAYHAWVLGYKDAEVNAFLYEALNTLGDAWNAEHLLSVVLKVGEVNLKCMALLD